MDVQKGLDRIQTILIKAIQAAERTEDRHLALLKSCHDEINTMLAYPEQMTPDRLTQIAFKLLGRCRDQDTTTTNAYDKIGLGLKLLSQLQAQQENTSITSQEQNLPPNAHPTTSVATSNKPNKTKVLFEEDCVI